MAQKFFLVSFEADEIGDRESFSELLERHDMHGDVVFDATRINLDHVSVTQIEQACQ